MPSDAFRQIREFKISGRTDGCASLLDPVSSYYSTDCTNTSGILERRAVPSVIASNCLGLLLTASQYCSVLRSAAECS